MIDYKNDHFEKILRDYDVVLDSLDAQTLQNSLKVLKPDGSSSQSRGRRPPISRRRSD